MALDSFHRWSVFVDALRSGSVTAVSKVMAANPGKPWNVLRLGNRWHSPFLLAQHVCPQPMYPRVRAEINKAIGLYASSWQIASVNPETIFLPKPPADAPILFGSKSHVNGFKIRAVEEGGNSPEAHPTHQRQESTVIIDGDFNLFTGSAETDFDGASTVVRDSGERSQVNVFSKGFFDDHSPVAQPNEAEPPSPTSPYPKANENAWAPLPKRVLNSKDVAKADIKTFRPGNTFTVGEGSSQRTFSFVRQIAAGSFGTAYLIKDSQTNRHYIGKFMSQSGREANFEKLNEVSIQAILGGHPNIPSIFCIAQSSSFMVIAMERGGKPLAKAIEAKGLPDTEYRALRGALVSAVTHMHAKNMFHLDIKPQNVVRRSNGEFRVIDFGESRQYKTDDNPKGINLEKEGQVCGTPLYMAPEATKGVDEKNASRVDSYAIGVSLLEAKIGSARLAQAVSSPNNIHSQVVAAAKNPSILPLSDWDRDFILSCLETDPARRPIV